MNTSSLLSRARLMSFLFLSLISSARATKPFELIIIPDSQKFVRVLKYGGPDIFLTQTRWIKKHVNDENIVFVTHVGDVIENKKEQWRHASKVMDVIHGVVPYSVTFGNHDNGAPAMFTAKRYQGMDWYLGASPDNKAHAQTFKGGGMSFLHINLPFRANNQHIHWAQTIIAAHPGIPTIISTHDYMADNRWGRSGTGNRIWNALVEPNQQVFMTLNGHDWVSRHEMGITKDGRKVIQIQANWQEIVNGGNAFLQKVIFDPDHKQIRAKSYSPLFDLFHTDWTGQFAYAVSFDHGKVTVHHEIGPKHCIWNGKGTNNHWSLAANWGGTAPKAGDILRFKNTKQKTTVNDLPPRTRFAGIVFEPGTFSGAYQISGHAITLTGDIVNMNTYSPKKPQSGPVLNLPIILKGDRQINSGDWDMTINGIISGSGSLTKTHGRDYIRGSFDGRVYLGDLYLTNINTYTGITRVTGGALILNNNTSSNLIPSSPLVRLYYSTVLKVTGLKNSTWVLSPQQTICGTGLVIGNMDLPRGASLAPGAQKIGTFHQTGNLIMRPGSSLRIQIGSDKSNPCDTVSVQGSVSLNGATLHLSSSKNHLSPKAGDVFVILKNDAKDAISGQFVNQDGNPLPEGASLHPAFLEHSLSARISYHGGDGNDVTLSISSNPQ